MPFYFFQCLHKLFYYVSHSSDTHVSHNYFRLGRLHCGLHHTEDMCRLWTQYYNMAQQWI